MYMLRCADGSYYVGKTQKSLDERIGEHDAGAYDGYTKKRRPVSLVWSQEFQFYTDANACERQIKGWSRAKKEALVRGDYASIVQMAKRRGGKPLP